MKTICCAAAFALLLSSSAWAAGVGTGSQTPAAVQPDAGPSVLDSIAKSPTLNSTRLVRDSRKIGVGDGEIRSFLLKPEVAVTRQEFFTRYRESLGLGKDDALQEKPAYTDPNGAVHLRYEQTYKGLPVLNSLFHLWEKDGLVRQAGGSLASGLNVDITPSFSETEALDAALNEIAAESYPWEVDPEQTAPKGTLVIAKAEATDSKYLLSYQFAVPASEPEGFYEVLVDAKSGEIVHIRSLYRTFTNVPATGQSFYNGEVSFLAGINDGGQHVLQSVADPNSPMAKADVAVNDMRPPTSGLVKDNDGDGTFSDPEDKAAVSVKWGIDKAFELFSSMCGWSGFDGSGVAKVSAKLRPLKANDVLAWYVHGQSIIEFNTDDVAKPGVEVYTVGHEISHGIVSHTGKLVYAGESGALDEGFAQFFGWAVDNYATNADLSAIGNVIDGCCDFPTTYEGAHYQFPAASCTGSNDYCGVHKNGWVWTVALAYLSQGHSGMNDNGDYFTVEGIGKAKAVPLAFLTMTTQLAPNSTFKDARNGLITVAELAYGKDSPEYIAAVNATYAVGLGAAYKPDLYISPDAGESEVPPWPAKLQHEVGEDVVSCEIEISPFKEGKLDASKKALKPGMLMSASGRIVCSAEFDLEANVVHAWRLHSKSVPKGISSMVSGLFSGGGAVRVGRLCLRMPRRRRDGRGRRRTTLLPLPCGPTSPRPERSPRGMLARKEVGMRFLTSRVWGKIRTRSTPGPRSSSGARPKRRILKAMNFK